MMAKLTKAQKIQALNSLTMPTNQMIFDDCIKPNCIKYYDENDVFLIYDLEAYIKTKISDLLDDKEIISNDELNELTKTFKISDDIYQDISHFWNDDENGENWLLDELIRLIAYREFAVYVFIKWENLYLSIKYSQLATMFYTWLKKDSKQDLAVYISDINAKNANLRWEKHNQTRTEKKKQYLQIMRDKGFTTYAQTATYIKQEIEKGDKPSYDTICRWLSQAGKGDFT